jgi:tetratricopeptide (TPR) repeat protein
MKKLIIFFFGLFLSLGTMAQGGLDKAILEQYKKDKESADKEVQNEKNKTKAKPWFVRGQAYETLALQAISVDSNAINTAVESYKKAIELDTKDGKEGKIATDARAALKSEKVYQGYLVAGDGYYRVKNYDKSLAAMQNAAEINPKKDTIAYVYISILGQVLQKNDIAVNAYRKLIEYGAKDPSNYLYLSDLIRNEAIAKKDTKLEDESLAIVNAGLAKNPTNKDLLAQKNNLYFAFNRLESAIESLKADIAKDPTNAVNCVNLGILYDNKATSLTSDIKKYTDELSKGGDSEKKMADAKEQMDVFNDEVKRLQDAIKKQPKNNDLKNRLATTQQSLAEKKAAYDAAKAKSDEAKASAGNRAETQKKLDDAVAQRNEFKASAKTYYEKALAADGKSYDALFNLGVLSFNEGVDIKHTVDAMDIKTYNEKGKAVEEQANTKFKEAIPLFEKAYSIKKEGDVKENLKALYRMLKMNDKLQELGE